MTKKNEKLEKLISNTMITGIAMLIPATIGRILGYDMRTVDTPYEIFAMISAFSATAPLLFGSVMYLIKCKKDWN